MDIKCLKCDDYFDDEGIYRICPQCKRSKDWIEGNEEYEVVE